MGYHLTIVKHSNDHSRDYLGISKDEFIDFCKSKSDIVLSVSLDTGSLYDNNIPVGAIIFNNGEVYSNCAEKLMIKTMEEFANHVKGCLIGDENEIIFCIKEGEMEKQNFSNPSLVSKRKTISAQTKIILGIIFGTILFLIKNYLHF